jgi:hypothetical protein
MHLFLLFLTIIAGEPASANISKNDCPNVDLRSSFGPNRGDGGAGWCWAQVSSDMLGYFEGIRPPNRISSIDLAVSTLRAPAEDFSRALENQVSNGLSRSQAQSAQVVMDRIKTSLGAVC